MRKGNIYRLDHHVPVGDTGFLINKGLPDTEPQPIPITQANRFHFLFNTIKRQYEVNYLGSATIVMLLDTATADQFYQRQRYDAKKPRQWSFFDKAGDFKDGVTVVSNKLVDSSADPMHQVHVAAFKPHDSGPEDVFEIPVNAIQSILPTAPKESAPMHRRIIIPESEWSGAAGPGQMQLPLDY